MTNKIKIQPLIFLLFCNIAFCQMGSEKAKTKIIELLKQSREAYNLNVGFTFKTNNKIYESYTSSNVLENTKGKYCKYGDNNYLKIHDGEIAKVDDFIIKTDGTSRLMQIEKSNNKEQQVYDLTNLVKSYTVFSFSESTNDYICSLEAEKISVTPYGKIIIYIDKKTKLIKKQVMFLYSTINFKNKEVIPRIEMIFSDFKIVNTKPKELFTNNYFKKVNSKYHPSKTYVGYQIID